jgi:hypothetical protein
MTPPIHFIIEFQINKLQKSVMLTKIAPQFWKVLYKWTPQEAKLLHGLKIYFKPCMSIITRQRIIREKPNWTIQSTGYTTKIPPWWDENFRGLYLYFYFRQETIGPPQPTLTTDLFCWYFACIQLVYILIFTNSGRQVPGSL